MKTHIENDVYKYRICFEKYKEISVFVKSVSNLLEGNLKREQFVKEKYFTKEKINELKKEFIKMIEESENPFNIYCYDEDKGYNITENEIFNLD